MKRRRVSRDLCRAPLILWSNKYSRVHHFPRTFVSTLFSSVIYLFFCLQGCPTCWQLAWPWPNPTPQEILPNVFKGLKRFPDFSLKVGLNLIATAFLTCRGRTTPPGDCVSTPKPAHECIHKDGRKGNPPLTLHSWDRREEDLLETRIVWLETSKGPSLPVKYEAELDQ